MIGVKGAMYLPASGVSVVTMPLASSASQAFTLGKSVPLSSAESIFLYECSLFEEIGYVRSWLSLGSFTTMPGQLSIDL
jgi:hypothetical protein